MRIGLLAYLLHAGMDYRAAGVSTYIRQLLAHLPQTGANHEYVAFHGMDSVIPPGVGSVATHAPTVRAPVRIAWEQVGFPWQARRKRVDMIHGIVNVVPLFTRAPCVVTVHDLAFLRHPDRFARTKVVYLRTAVAASVRRADHVIAVSRNTRADLVELLGIANDRITVIYPGVDPQFRPLLGEKIERFRSKLFNGRPYILHVGTLEPRKNLDVLISAYARARMENKIPHALVFAGARGWMFDALFAQVRTLGLREDVRFIDYMPVELLPLCYNGADLFTYPSAYEGFGLPVVEAMACGIPVVTSNSSSLAEVSAGACLTVEPGSIEELHMAIVRVLHSPSEAERLREAGLKRASDFDWMTAARQTVRVYERTLMETIA